MRWLFRRPHDAIVRQLVHSVVCNQKLKKPKFDESINHIYMNRDFFWKTCCLVSILYAFAFLLIPILFVYHVDDLESRQQLSLFVSKISVSILFSIMGLVSFIFWIHNIILWNRRKDSIVNLLLLLFFSFIYAPIYFIRNRWIGCKL